MPLLLESIAMRKQVCLQRLRDCAESTAAQPGDEPEWAQLTRELISEATTTNLQAELQWLEQMHKRIQSRLAVAAEGRATLRPDPQRSGGKERAA